MKAVTGFNLAACKISWKQGMFMQRVRCVSYKVITEHRNNQWKSGLTEGILN